MRRCFVRFFSRTLIALISIQILATSGYCETLYQEDFSSDPSYTSLAPTYAYWNSAGEYYYVNTRDDLNHKYWGHSPDIGLVDTSQNINIEFDVLFEYQDWGTYPGVYFYMDMPEGSEDQFRSYSSIGVLDLYTDTVFKKIRIMDDSGNYYQSSTVKDDTWYKITIRLNGDSTADLNIVEKTNGNTLLDQKNVSFNPKDFRYIGIGYFNKPDYGNSFSPIRVDNIKIYRSKQNQSIPKVYGLFVGVDYSDKDYDLRGNYLGKFTDGGDGSTWVQEYFNHFSDYTNWVGTESSSVLILKEGDTDNANKLTSAIQNFTNTLKAGDTFVFLFIGHGGRLDSGFPEYISSDETTLNSDDEYLNLSGSRIVDDNFSTLLSSENWSQVNKFFILNSCESGGFWGDHSVGDIGDLAKLGKVSLLAAAKEGSTTSYSLSDGTPLFSKVALECIDEYDSLDINVLQNCINEDTRIDPFIGQIAYPLAEGSPPVVFAKTKWNPAFNKTEDFIAPVGLTNFPWNQFLPAIIQNKK